jgi:hypothetical protein
MSKGKGKGKGKVTPGDRGSTVVKVLRYSGDRSSTVVKVQRYSMGPR